MLSRRVAEKWMQAARALPLDNGEIESLAKEILRELPKHLKFKEMSSPLWMTRGFTHNWGFELERGFKTTNVRGHPVQVAVEVRAKAPQGKGRDYVIEGGAKGHYYADSRGQATGHKLFTRLLVYINQEQSPQSLMDALPGSLYKELLSVLRHEVTHLRDILKHEGDLQTPEAYHNSKAEVRAFMRQVSDEVVEYAHAVGKDRDLGSSFVPEALAKSPTWQRIRPHLNAANERLVLQAASRALQDVWAATSPL